MELKDTVISELKDGPLALDVIDKEGRGVRSEMGRNRRGRPYYQTATAIELVADSAP